MSRAVYMAVQTKLPEASVCRESVCDTPLPRHFPKCNCSKTQLFSGSEFSDFLSLPLPGFGERRPVCKSVPGYP